MKKRRNAPLMLSLVMRGMINRHCDVVPMSATTYAAVRDPSDSDQRKLEAKRARRAQLRRQGGKP